MNVETLMTKKVSACLPQDTMQRAAQIFWERDCGCAPVTDEQHHVLGVITDRDVCIAAYTQGKKLDQIPVSSAMSRHAFTCRPTDSIASAEQAMRANKVRRLPVVDTENHLVGLLSLNDIAREAARERADAKKAVTDKEVAETLSTVCTPGASGVLARR